MSNQVTLRSSTQSLPRTILITSNEDPSKQADLVGGLISIAYFESILSDTLGTITFTDTGINNVNGIKESILEDFNRRTRKSSMKFEDNNEVTIGDKPELVCT